MLKLTNYKPKLNERAVGVGVEPTRSSYFPLLVFPKSSPPRQGGVSAKFHHPTVYLNSLLQKDLLLCFELHYKCNN
jgi:hypothetical protein